MPDPSPPSEPSRQLDPESLQLAAALLAICIPGAGQFSLGYRARGICIAIGVLGLFFGGLLMGGLNCVDSRENRLWFIPQAIVGPVAFITDNIHQRYFKGIAPGIPRPVTPGPNETITTDKDGTRRIAQRTSGPPLIIRSFGRPNELGVLFAAIAGMLNLICIIDAAWSRRCPAAPTSGAAA